MFSSRTQREKKSKKIFSPSDPPPPSYYLICHGSPESYQIVGRTSVQKVCNDKAIVSNIRGEVQIITAGYILSVSRRKESRYD